ncbi:MAG: nucleotidyltransferase family protein [Burkholderiaceae bacterium]|nr:nucleotidyltransferase family protein [Burkholderiaceae bacterium]
MLLARSALPAHVRLLLQSLIDARSCATLAERRWELLLRAARAARLLGVIAARVEAAVPSSDLPEVAQRQLAAGRIEARFRRQKVLHLLATIEPQLRTTGEKTVLLKGAAYIALGLPMAAGRLPADVDVMVPRRALDTLEQSLREAGWEFEKNDPYDQHYYRAWSHELPPLQRAGQALELDVHHTILPPLGRLKPDTETLFADAVAVPGTPYHALCPPDQVLHAAAHLFQDSDCAGRLRDLVDIDALLRHFAAADADFWAALIERADRHRLARPLWYALAASHAWLDTPLPSEMVSWLAGRGPPYPMRSLLGMLVTRTLPPVDPDREPGLRDAISVKLLEARAAWLRMPPGLLAYHIANKAWRSRRLSGDASAAV